MEQNNVIEKWYLLLPDAETQRICKKYFPETPYMEVTWDQIYGIYEKEHPTEAEVSKEVQPKLVQWVESNCPPLDLNAKPELVLELVTAYKQQKEKDRELISELLELVKCSRPLILPCDYLKGDDYLAFMGKTEESITKAEKHLNNQ